MSPTRVRAWLIKAGVPRRTISEGKRGQKPAPQTIAASVRSRRKHVLAGRAPVGYKIDGYGYVLVAVEGRGYVREHRLVMEQHLGRQLTRLEDVHHINRDRRDNRLSNLQLVLHRDHLREHYAERSIDPSTGRFL